MLKTEGSKSITMSDSLEDQLTCSICEGNLSAVVPNLNFEHVASFNCNWICDGCGAKFTEEIEVEKKKEVEEDDTTDETTPETIDSTVTQCPECGSSVNDDGNGETVCEDCGLVIQEAEADDGPDWQAEGEIGRPEWQGFDDQKKSPASSDEGEDSSTESAEWKQSFDKKIQELNKERQRAEAEEAERKRRVIETAEEMDVEWQASYGDVVDQTEQLVVAQTLYRNQFALISKETGECIDEVEIVSDHRNSAEKSQKEWDSDDIPDDIELHSSGTLELKERPGWRPKKGSHWCVGGNSLFIFDDRGVSRYSNTGNGPDWTIKGPGDNKIGTQICCIFRDDLLFVASPSVLCAIQTDTGEVSWDYELSGENLNSLRLFVYSDALYLSEGSNIVSLYTESGDENWIQKLGREHRDQELRYFGGVENNILLTVEESDTNYVCGYDVESGKQQWRFQDRRKLNILQIYDEMVYLDGSEGEVLGLEVSNGVLKWQQEFRKLERRSGDHKVRAWHDRTAANYLTITDEGIVTANWSGSISLLDPQTGKREWEVYPEDADVGPETACRVVEDAVIRIKDTQIEAFDLTTGEERWSFETKEMVPTDTTWGKPAVADDVVYFIDYSGTLYEANPEPDGLRRISHPEEETRRSFAIDSERVYVGSLDPSADIPAYRRAQEAGTESKSTADSESALLNLQALSR